MVYIQRQLTHVGQMTNHLPCRVRHDCDSRSRSRHFPQEDPIQIPCRACSLRTLPFLLLFHLLIFSSDQAGEEQGLWGSRSYSRESPRFWRIPQQLRQHIGELRDSGANVTFMVQSDMLAYHVPGEHAQLAFPET